MPENLSDLIRQLGLHSATLTAVLQQRPYSRVEIILSAHSWLREYRQSRFANCI